MLLSAVITVNAASFKDVKSSDWYYSSVNYVAEQGIMNGTSNTKFSPKASLTRAMGVTLLYRVAGSPSVAGVTLPFNDVKGGQWYTNAVKWAYKNGIVTGKSSTYFHTNGNITRAEFATILKRYSDFKKYTLPVNRSDSFADSGKVPSWAFMAVWAMYRAEIINGRDDGRFDPNAKITRAEAAAMIERFMKSPKDGNGNSDNTNTETQPPIETPEVPTTGKLVIKDKKYDYNGANVMILNVENQTNKDLNVTISAKYLDASGKIVYAENRKIEGFPANYRHYIVLQPGIKFDKFSYEVTTSSYSGPAYLQHVKCGNDVDIKLQPSIQDSHKDGIEPRAELDVKFYLKSLYSKQTLYYKADFVLFDKNGEIFWIENYHGGHKLGYDPSDDATMKTRICTLHVLYKDFTMPSNLKDGCTGLIAIIDIADYPFSGFGG